MNAGNIFWVEFPAGAGRAQAGRRPAIVAQDAAASARLPTVLLIPLTTQQDALRFPGTLLIQPDKTNRLSRISVALIFQLSAVTDVFLVTALAELLQRRWKGSGLHWMTLRVEERAPADLSHEARRVPAPRVLPAPPSLGGEKW